MTYKSNFQVADQCSIINSHYSATIVAILDGLLQSHNFMRINIEQRGWDSEAIEKNRKKEKAFHKNIYESRSWVWLEKKQYHKEKEDSLKVVTVLRGNKLYRRCAGTQV